jgi:hypothetical protein
MTHHEEHDHEKEQPKREGASPSEKQLGDHEVNPAEGPGPRGNPDRDEERVRHGLEDLERSGSH